MNNRVVVVQHTTGYLIKVCNNWQSFDQWFDEVCTFDRDEIETTSASVREKQ